MEVTRIQLEDTLVPLFKASQGHGSGKIKVQLSSVTSLDQLGCQGDMTDYTAEIFFHSFLQKALVSSSGMGRDVHTLMLSIQQFPLPTTVTMMP